ncbi:ethanolamine ammonia-lyase subunit EutC [Acetobacter sp. DsW_063]|uniref:ethanolamine ammonia-lyase subunit EutC n=1 Tax=Acetobacter sp. DsW_063 TaxID=1514894 RepID=UPI000A3AE07F|nr:ethanolamine ammonia-lyase subunit EutC [Acetobacter sp. DsW_063]OUJ15588.1 ethanolamine ammonia-lyase [Acetobacter sp. DsW_063]
MNDRTPEPRGVDPWADLRDLTIARVGLGRCGDAIPARDVLAFQLAHAQARNAVGATLDAATLGLDNVVEVHSRATDRATFLQRPDLGRQLAEKDAPRLPPGAYDVVFVLADGLSATAVTRQAPGVLAACLKALPGWSVAPVVVAHQARVALGDEIGERLAARFVVIMIGERPGLSVADSLSLYITANPRPGRADSERNCISNIQPRGGLSPESAADKLAWLLREAVRIGGTGVNLKDDPSAALPSA